MELKLKHIKHDCCPECKARWVQVGYDTTHFTSNEVMRHVNGGEWEYIRYLCGRMDKYIPNFQQVEIVTPCSKNAEQVADQKRREKAFKAIEDVLGSQLLTKDERERIESTIRCTLTQR